MLMLMGLVMTTLVSEDKLRLSFETQSFASTSSNDVASNRYVVFRLPESHEKLTLMYRNVIEKMSAISWTNDRLNNKLRRKRWWMLQVLWSTASSRAYRCQQDSSSTPATTTTVNTNKHQPWVMHRTTKLWLISLFQAPCTRSHSVTAAKATTRYKMSTEWNWRSQTTRNEWLASSWRTTAHPSREPPSDVTSIIKYRTDPIVSLDQCK